MHLACQQSLVLTGCNSSAPSTSEAKQVAEDTFGNCDTLKVTDFERVNGIPQNDGSYVVQVKYNVPVTPTDEIKAYMRDTYPVKMAELQAKASAVKDATKKYSEMLATLKAANPMASENDLWATHPDLKALFDQTSDFNAGSPEAQATELPEQAKRMIANSLFQACPKVKPMVLFNAIEKPGPVEPFAGDVDLPFTGTYTMIKTDNGWQAAS
jgi:hypothetical protein